MKTIGSLIILLLAFSSAIAQKGYYAEYNWDKTPKKYSVTEEELKQDEVIVYEKRSVEIREKDGNYVQLMLVHTVTLLNTDAAIEDNNKVYVANGPESNVIRQQARVIKPDGKIIELDQDDIQESKDEEGQVEYRYFALDGIEKGCYIEYLHYIERAPNFTGAVMAFQSGVTKKDVEVDIICPKTLEYQIYPINGMPEFKRDSTAYLVRRMYVHEKNIPSLENEPFSAYEAQLQKCYYKVNRNTESNKSNFYNYAAITKIIHENMYAEPSKKAKKAMQKLIKDADPGASASLETRIRALENKLKSEINVIDFSFEGSFDIEVILQKKLTDAEGMTKLMVQLLREMGVKHELVLTSNKNENPFISEFEGYNFLVEDMIYINDLDMYMSPGFISRLGFPPYAFTNTKGLFIKEVSVNDMVTAVGKIKDIKGTKAEQSMDEINTEVTFDEGMSDCSVKVERIASGYQAEYPQAILDFLEEERKKEAREEFLMYIDKEAKLEDPTFENDNTAATGVKPLIGRATIKGSTFIEKAGDKTLLKAGLLIGPQAELYNEDERELPVETGFTHQYKRQIVINIPKDQVVKNPEALVFNVTPDKESNRSGFVSSYEIKGDQLIVTVYEYYKVTTYTAAEYPLYEEVMNAAADFNKVVLVFDKK